MFLNITIPMKIIFVGGKVPIPDGIIDVF